MSSRRVSEFPCPGEDINSKMHFFVSFLLTQGNYWWKGMVPKNLIEFWKKYPGEDINHRKMHFLGSKDIFGEKAWCRNITLNSGRRRKKTKKRLSVKWGSESNAYFGLAYWTLPCGFQLVKWSIIVLWAMAETFSWPNSLLTSVEQVWLPSCRTMHVSLSRVWKSAFCG